MDNFRLCWQVIPGGRTECLPPNSQDIAEFGLREQREAFPGLKNWLVETDRSDQMDMMCWDGDE